MNPEHYQRVKRVLAKCAALRDTLLASESEQQVAQAVLSCNGLWAGEFPRDAGSPNHAGSGADPLDLSCANLAGGVFVGPDCCLRGANLRQANLDGTLWYCTVVTDADFTGASLCGAVMEAGVSQGRVNFQSADLSGAKIALVTLFSTAAGCIDCTGANLTGATIEVGTMDKCPKLILTEARMNGCRLRTAPSGSGERDSLQAILASLSDEQRAQIALEEPPVAGWYSVESDAKHVRQIVLTLPPDARVPSRVKGSLIHRSDLMVQQWAGVTLFLDGSSPEEKGPFIFAKANGVADDLKGREAKLAFAFYRYPTGGVLQIFVCVESPVVKARAGHHFIIENSHCPENDDSKELIPALLDRRDLEVCFLADAQEAPCQGQFGLRVRIPDDCRSALKNEWQSLNDYHSAVAASAKDRRAAMTQFERENDIQESPVLDAPVQSELTSIIKLYLDNEQAGEKALETFVIFSLIASIALGIVACKLWQWPGWGGLLLGIATLVVGMICWRLKESRGKARRKGVVRSRFDSAFPRGAPKRGDALLGLCWLLNELCPAASSQTREHFGSQARGQAILLMERTSATVSRAGGTEPGPFPVAYLQAENEQTCAEFVVWFADCFNALDEMLTAFRSITAEEQLPVDGLAANLSNPNPLLCVLAAQWLARVPDDRAPQALESFFLDERASAPFEAVMHGYQSGEVRRSTLRAGASLLYMAQRGNATAAAILARLKDTRPGFAGKVAAHACHILELEGKQQQVG